MKRVVGLSYNSRLKLEVLSHYSPSGDPRCAWPTCDISDVDMLTLDHIEDGGNADRRRTGKGGGCATYAYLRKNRFPHGFQVLCMNHQFKKEIVKRRAAPVLE